ncbi:hypothetical protein PG993_008662 [Apiospora rasikravindrae]|uniref:Uncharacterized protein n=1 Tax=Apiospora rasikravindrae TaxID=990691 RepID=A0ABR1SSJ3_9PEZI
MRDLCTRAPEGARWLSTQIVCELARVDTTPADRASDQALPKALKRPRDSDPPYQSSKRGNMTEEPPQTPADVSCNDDGPSFEQDSQVGQRKIKRLRSENTALVGRLHEALEQVNELHHSARVADPTHTLSLLHENLVLKKQLLADQTAREDSALIETGSLGPSKKDIKIELEVIEYNIAGESVSLCWSSRVLDGSHALHKVELLAYHSLVSEPHFDTHFVAGHTESLAGYMWHILEPLLDSEPYNELGTSDSEPSTSFGTVMEHTIELAAKLCLTDRRCIWKFFQPGSNFDPQTMKIERTSIDTSETGHRARQASSGDVETVQLCIFPVFYMSKTLGSRTSPGGNERTAMNTSDDLSDYQLVAKGLVLVQ